jgi:hypothetical protein
MRSFLILAMLCPFLSHCMPPRNTIPPLSVGDAYPPFTLFNIVNYTSTQLSVPASGNTLYILNFVAIACPSCVRDYSRLDLLQKQFGKKIQVIFITAENAARVKSFLNTNKTGRQLSLPVATSDTLLASWFPHRFLSHTVWLQNGVVKGITDPQYIDENNIEILLMGRTPGWPLKNDGIPYNPSRPLLSAAGTPANGRIAPSYSMFSPFIDGGNSTFHQSTDSATASVKTTMINLPIVRCYLHAYGLSVYFPVSQVELNVKDSARYIYNPKKYYRLEWEHHNTWSYESVLPSSLSAQEQQQKIISDLDFYFGIRSSLEIRNYHCLALVTVANKNAKPLLTSGNAPAFISLSNLVYHINHNWYSIPVFDETGITGNYFLPFDEAVFSDLPTLNAFLYQYGLQLKPVEKQVQILTLTEIRPQSANGIITAQ